ncbi:peptidoglycan editing factor PgeF [Halalkalibaculum sp. DA3122]|uniref:peptidoglycan editing factor PgeF n=1 Tax=unclassified Halalkalibaculum TaxID=2964617 RepID=UPI0037552342
MSIYTNNLKLVEPSILNDETGINAWFTQKNAELVNSSADVPGLNLGFNTDASREQVVANRDLLFKALGQEPDWTAFAEQVHGTRVRVVNSGGVFPETDGLVTRIPGLALGIQVADCAAVLLADPVMNVVAALHAGWRGAAGDILPNGLQVMREQGCTPSDIRAWIGPCICQEHFEVGEEVAEQFPARFVDRSSFEKPHVDLRAFLQSQLVGQGLDRSHIQADQRCTVGDAKLFYSHRRENGHTGRMMAIIQLSD